MHVGICTRIIIPTKPNVETSQKYYESVCILHEDNLQTKFV